MLIAHRWYRVGGLSEDLPVTSLDNDSDIMGFLAVISEIYPGNIRRRLIYLAEPPTRKDHRAQTETRTTLHTIQAFVQRKKSRNATILV